MFVHGRSVYDRAQILYWGAGFVLEFDTLRLTLQIVEIARHGLSVISLWRETLQIGEFKGITLQMVETVRVGLSADSAAVLGMVSKQKQSIDASARSADSETFQVDEKASGSLETKEKGQENLDL